MAAQYYDIYHYHDIFVWYYLEIQYRDIVIIVFPCSFQYFKVLAKWKWSSYHGDIILSQYDYCSASYSSVLQHV